MSADGGRVDLYRIVAQYKVLCNRDSVGAVPCRSETVTVIAPADGSGDGVQQEFFSRGDGHNHASDMLPGGALFLGHTLQEAIQNLKDDHDA